MKHDITLNKAILHVLDTNVIVPVLSNGLLSMSEEITEFITKHIQKAVDDAGVKRTSFRDESPFKIRIKDYQKHSDELVRISSEIAQLFFDIMVENLTIPSADLLCVDFDLGGENFLGLLKFNYTRSYIHHAKGSKNPVNEILIQPCALPTKLDEFVLINLSNAADSEILLKEKKYMVNDEKMFYLSDLILLSKPVLSEKEAFSIVDKAVKDIIAKEYNNDYAMVNTAKTVFVDDFITDGGLDTDNIADIVFDGNKKMQAQFKEQLEENGLFDTTVPILSSIENKICSKQKYITDTGIEILIPTEQLKRSDVIEFINNADGTVSVAIKNIGLLSQK